MTDVLWVIVWILVGVFAIAIVNKIRFEVSTNIKQKARTSALRDPNASMGEIVEAVKYEPEGLTPEVRARFWSLAEDFTTDAEFTVAAIAQTHLPMHRYLCLIHEDALDSFHSRIPKKSAERLELESRLIADNNTVNPIIVSVNQYLEDIAARKPASLFAKEGDQGHLYDEELIGLELDLMCAGEVALKKLFVKP